MTIPIVKTAIAPNNGMPAHPAPNARYFRYEFLGTDTYQPNCKKVPVFSSFSNSLTFSQMTSLVQIYTPVDIIFCTNIDQDSLIIEDILDACGMILKAGGYYSFSVTPGSMFFVKSLDRDDNITILEG